MAILAYMFWFIIFTLTITFTVAGYLTWREENARKEMLRDINSEWYEKNHIKRP